MTEQNSAKATQLHHLLSNYHLVVVIILPENLQTFTATYP